MKSKVDAALVVTCCNSSAQFSVFCTSLPLLLQYNNYAMNEVKSNLIYNIKAWFGVYSALEA